MSEIGKRIDELHEREVTHQKRYLLIMDKLGKATNGWVDSLVEWAPVLPPEFRLATTPLFTETSNALKELRECAIDLSDDIQEHVNILHDLAAQFKESEE